MILKSRRLPAVLGLSLGILTALSQRHAMPQALANAGYEAMFSDAPARRNEATGLFQRAVQADPAFPWRWSDLAVASSGADVSGDTRVRTAEYCFARSVELGPGAPQMAFRAANYYFRTNETARAMRLTAQVVRQTSGFDEMVFQTWAKFGGGGRSVRELGLGENGRAAAAWFRFLSGRPEADAAGKAETWRWMEEKKFATPELARGYAGLLLRKGRGGEAVEVWARHVANPQAGFGISNFVDDPGFEGRAADTTADAGAVFDWRIGGCPGVTIARDESTRHSGTASLRLSMAAEDNIDFHHVEQTVWLTGGRYRLSAWMRTESLTTDEGVAVTVSEAGASSAALTGTNDWKMVSADFTVTGAARPMTVRIVRKPSWRFDNKPHGTVWVDDVQIRQM